MHFAFQSLTAVISMQVATLPLTRNFIAPLPFSCSWLAPSETKRPKVVSLKNAEDTDLKLLQLSPAPLPDNAIPL